MTLIRAVIYPAGEYLAYKTVKKRGTSTPERDLIPGIEIPTHEIKTAIDQSPH
jgi:hypothetical protein